MSSPPVTNPVTNPTRAEVEALLVGWRKLEAARTRGRLRVERQQLAQLRNAVRLHVDQAATWLEHHRIHPKLQKVTAIHTIRQTSEAIRDSLTRGIAAARTEARDVSRDLTTDEFNHLRKMLRKDGYSGSELPPDPVPAAADHDLLAASNAAGSVASRWGNAALGATLAWDDPSTSLPSAIRATSAAVAPQLETIAATEVSAAWNEEHEDALEPLSDYDWAPQVFKVWSAILDGVVCSRCFEMDGQAVPTDEPWPEGADLPLHPRCRCMAVPLYIPKPKRLQDIAIDYAGYKAEMRDLIREGRSRPVVPGGDRHAANFIQRSKGEGRSPIVISRDFSTDRLRRSSR